MSIQSPSFEQVWATDGPPSQQWPIYTRGNVGEVFPDVVLPLTWDLVSLSVENGIRTAFSDMGLLMDGDIAADEPMVVFGVFGGYCYLNVSVLRLLGVRAPGGAVEDVDKMILGESDAPPHQPRKGEKNLLSTLKLGGTVLKLMRTKKIAGLDQDYADVKAYMDRYPGDGASDQALLSHLRELSPLFEPLFARHCDNTFRGSLISGAVVDLLTKVDMEDQLVSILGGIGDVQSAAPSAAMWKLAGSATATASINAAFDDGVDGLLDRLASIPDASAWLADFDAFLAGFGSRGPNEWDLASDPWEFRPELALAAIDRMRAADESHDPTRQASRLATERHEAVAAVRAALKAPDRFQFDRALRATTLYSQAREQSKTTIILAVHSARRAQAELARRIAARGGPADRWKTCLIGLDEYDSYVADPVPFAAVVSERAELHGKLSGLIPPFVVNKVVPPIAEWTPRGATAETLGSGDAIEGIAGCPGIARGVARVVLDPGEPGDLGPGDVLIAPITDPSWTPLFLAVEAVVVDVGATMSHAVIVARELGIPCIVSATGATTKIADGSMIEVDGNAGTVTIVEGAKA